MPNIAKKRYLIYEDGRIVDTVRNIDVKVYGQNDKYMYVYLATRHDPNTSFIYRIHALVATMFVKNPDPKNKTTVNHKDLDTHNNHVSNLEWMSYKENNDHSQLFGNGAQFKSGAEHPNSKYTDAIVNDICYLLEEGYDHGYIASYVLRRFPELSGIKRTNVIKQISKINRGERWTHISKWFNLGQESSTTNEDINSYFVIKILI